MWCYSLWLFLSFFVWWRLFLLHQRFIVIASLLLYSLSYRFSCARSNGLYFLVPIICLELSSGTKPFPSFFFPSFFHFWGLCSPILGASGWLLPFSLLSAFFLSLHSHWPVMQYQMPSFNFSWLPYWFKLKGSYLPMVKSCFIPILIEIKGRWASPQLDLYILNSFHSQALQWHVWR